MSENTTDATTTSKVTLASIVWPHSIADDIMIVAHQAVTEAGIAWQHLGAMCITPKDPESCAIFKDHQIEGTMSVAPNLVFAIANVKDTLLAESKESEKTFGLIVETTTPGALVLKKPGYFAWQPASWIPEDRIVDWVEKARNPVDALLDKVDDEFCRNLVIIQNDNDPAEALRDFYRTVCLRGLSVLLVQGQSAILIQT